MRLRTRNAAAALLAVALTAPCLPLPAAGKERLRRPQAFAANPARQQDPPANPEQHIEERDAGQNGITVAEPKIYDDALLQQMLRAAEMRLAALQLIDQTSIATRLGAVTGASQQTSAVAVNVQGPSVPGVVTTEKLPTETTTEGTVTAPTGTTTTLQTVSNLPVQDVVTTRSPFSPPTAVAPAPTTTMPSSFSVSASDILNEQMQLTAEINGLRLLLAGSLSDYFMKHRPGHEPGEQELPKLKTTLGFHISVTPNKHYKDAVAIVEVEVGIRGVIERGVRADAVRNKNLCPAGAEEREDCVRKLVNKRLAGLEQPAVTAIIPREKTYNVAAITDKSTSIGGGVATQIVGFSGSWVRGHKTYYLVQDQDTVALTYRPADGEKTGFRWQFRPVLGQRYVKAGLKQTFVQLAFPTLPDALGGEIGRVTVRTYWRKYDRKAAILKEIVPGSYREMYRDVDIPSFKQPVMPIAFDAATGVEDLGGGQALVKLVGRFLPGTYVRIGSLMLTEAGGLLKFEHHGIKFTAPFAILATREIFIVAHDGREQPLRFTVSSCAPGNEPQVSEVKATPVDESTSRLRVRVTPAAFATAEALPRPVFVIGQRVFGHADAPLKIEEEGEAGKPNHKVYLSAVVPNAVYTPTAELVVKPLFAPPGCSSKPLPIGGLKPPGPDRLTLLERGETEITFLLRGTGLKDLNVLSPMDARVVNVVDSEADKMRLLILKTEHLRTHKQVLLQRGGAAPFLIAIPELEPKAPAPPKAFGIIGVGGDEVEIVGDGLSEVEVITFKEQPVTTFKIVNDQTLRITGLAALGLTASAGPKRIFIKFKSEARPKEVVIEVFNGIFTTKQ